MPATGSPVYAVCDGSPVGYASAYGGEVWRKPAPALAVPAVSGAWVVYVARDISLATGRWVARTVGGAAALTLGAYGTPAISTAETWAPGVPVLSCATGCFFADRSPFPDDHGFTLAACWNSATVNDVAYLGPTIYGATDQACLRFRSALVSSIPRIEVRRGNGGAGGTVRWDSANDTAGVLRQWDRPAGAATLNAIRVFENNVETTTVSQPGGATIRSSGPRLALGGIATADAAVLTLSPQLRILMAALKVDGMPASAADRAALVTFANGLKTGTIQ